MKTELEHSTDPSASQRGTVFPVCSLDRGHVKWEDYLLRLTPCEFRGGLWFKRDDCFSPLGYGGINGGKLRQLVHLVHSRVLPGRFKGLISAGSVKSPQHSFASVTALHYGLKSLHVLGATKAETCTRHSSVAIANAAGAEFDFIEVGYNAALQQRLRALAAGEAEDYLKFATQYYPIDYAISLEHARHPLEDVRRFHAVGAEQVKNIPDEVETLIIPAGSCNTLASILYGLILYPKPGVKHLHLVGVGHKKRLRWMAERLSGLGLEFLIDGGGDSGKVWSFTSDVEYTFTYHDLLGTGYCTYNDYWPNYFHGIQLHPTYEAKMARWLEDNRPDLLNPRALFWIIGSEPLLEPMSVFLGGRNA